MRRWAIGAIICWVTGYPHAGIAVRLTTEALKEAFAIVQERFHPFEAVVERIVLAKAEPYEEMQSWELKDYGSEKNHFSS